MGEDLEIMATRQAVLFHPRLLPIADILHVMCPWKKLDAIDRVFCDLDKLTYHTFYNLKEHDVHVYVGTGFVKDFCPVLLPVEVKPRWAGVFCDGSVFIGTERTGSVSVPLHEVGHAVDLSFHKRKPSHEPEFHAMWKTWSDQDTGEASARINPGECFAEAFAIYKMLGFDALKARFGHTFAMHMVKIFNKF